MAQQFPSVQEFKEMLNKSIVWADIVKIFDYLLTVGVELWASDIHIEPFENFARIRLRIDWVLQELVQYPKNLHDSVISKFKIESWQMRPDEKRIPQDARVSTITQTNKEIDLRANTLPTVWWEKLCMRIVDKSKKTPPLEVLGIEWINGDLITKAIEQPNGIMMTTWPTWSWKTTTMYASLAKINNVDIDITTFEDPVENKMFWLNQSQVRADIGFTFASWLRSALRQDPDVILVWEIRDHETLDMAMEAAMTWHMVVSTIHTNSAAETLTRISNMWAKWFMIAWTFNIVMAQRLARKVCDHCKVAINVSSDERYQWTKQCFASMDKDILKAEIIQRWIDPNVWQAYMSQWVAYIWSWKDPATWEVCPVCLWSWCKWRVWVYEILHFNEEVKEMVMRDEKAMDVEKVALARWMISLERDAVFKVIKGFLPLDAVYKLVKHKE